MIREIPSSQLRAFAEVVKTSNISAAARSLFITQPALSMRLKQLEETLGCQLFLRGRRVFRITQAGYQLLKYIRAREAIEEEILGDILEPSKNKLKGMLKVAGHFSIINHVAIPTLQDLLLKHPAVQIESIIREDDELPEILMKGEADFVFLQKPFQRADFANHLLGSEEYVLIEGTNSSKRTAVYIDSEPSDVITEQFLSLNKIKTESYQRSFLHDEAGILRGVALGLGRAVVARNELRTSYPVKQVRGYKPLKIPSYLTYSKQNYYTQLQLAVREAFLTKCKKFLVT